MIRTPGTSRRGAFADFLQMVKLPMKHLLSVYPADFVWSEIATFIKSWAAAWTGRPLTPVRAAGHDLIKVAISDHTKSAG